MFIEKNENVIGRQKAKMRCVFMECGVLVRACAVCTPAPPGVVSVRCGHLLPLSATQMLIGPPHIPCAAGSRT